VLANKIPGKLLKDIFPKRLTPILPSKETYDILKRMILTGELKNGEILIPNTVAKQLKVGDIAVRKAFSQLRKDGLIVPRRGACSVVK
jgi:DNA-binding GntR family transcriptional regulator